MNKNILLVTMALCLNISTANTAVAQTAKDPVGTWSSVSNVSIHPDGSRASTFGPHGTGMAIFESNGRFAIIDINPDTPRFASNNRTQGTAEENKAVVLGGIALFGTYSVGDKVISLKAEGSTYPGRTGTDQRRTITA